MSNTDQLDIRETKLKGTWLLEFPYHEDYVSYIKTRVPSACRQYSEETKMWTIRDPSNTYMPALESVGVQKFKYALKTYYNANGKYCVKNLKTGIITTYDTHN